MTKLKSRHWWIAGLSLAVAVAVYAQRPPSEPRHEAIHIDTTAAGQPFPHFWERMFGSGRAILSVRDGYRQDLRAVKQATGFEYVRFHAILDDDTGVYAEDAQGRPLYNFSYIDQIYDGLLENGVRPFVELSFMPAALAASTKPHAFWYKPLPNPPKDYGKWGEMITAFTRHLVERYGVAEVAQWYFEVWNEPNIDFWTGEPKQPTYLELYDTAARGIKRVSAHLRVGGPATAQAAWAPEFIRHCVEQKVPLDFFSTHVYGNDRSEDVFGTHEPTARADMVARAVKKIFEQVKASPRPDLPIIWSEYNASYMNEVAVTDSPFMGPWLANNIRQCDGLTTMMSYWTFSDVFEEQGVVKKPFYGGYGLIAERGIPKPAFNAFALLHRLGTRRLKIDSPSAIATKTDSGALEVAVWNYAEPEQSGAARSFTVEFSGPMAEQATVEILDRNHGSSLTAWEAMGRPAFPTREQIQRLRGAARMPAPQPVKLSGGKIELKLPPHALALIEANPNPAPPAP